MLTKPILQILPCVAVRELLCYVSKHSCESVMGLRTPSMTRRYKPSVLEPRLGEVLAIGIDNVPEKGVVQRNTDEVGSPKGESFVKYSEFVNA